MRVAHVLFGGLGGHGSVVFSLISASEGKADHVLAFVSRDELLDAYRRECEARDIPAVHVDVGGKTGLRSHLQVAKWLWRQRPDAILVHSGGYLPAALLTRLLSPLRSEVVLVEHQSWPLRGRRHRLTTVLALATRTPIVTLTEAYAASLRDAYPRMSKRSDIVVIPNGVDLDRFSPAAGPPRLGSPPVIGMASRLITIKDHPTLLRAAAELLRGGTSIRVRLAGDGPTREALELLAGELRISSAVDFIGTLGESDLAEFLRGLDLYVHASLGEAMSTALLQAFATQLPVLASDVSGIREMVEGHDIAVLVPPTDPVAMAGAISNMLSKDVERTRLARHGHDFVASRYSSVAMWAAYQALLDRRKPEQLMPASPLQRLVAVTLEPDRLVNAQVLVWPAGAAPRVAATSSRAGLWLMRTGIIGGGGRPWLRWLVRQVVAWPLVRSRARRYANHAVSRSSES
jgi:glycosyltransferase involved in cell wall biosynthesis